MNRTRVALRDSQLRYEPNPVPPDALAAQSSLRVVGSEVQQGWDLFSQRPQEIVVRKILVPTNFSPASTQALEQAVVLADQLKCRLTILHVIDINAQTSFGTAQDLMRKLWDQGSEEIERLTWSISNKIQAQTVLVEGLPWEVIVERSREFDLLVLGKNTIRKLGQLFSKHTARRVVENSQCPVMLVPANRKERSATCA